jgi:catalase (peroxidase I)
LPRLQADLIVFAGNVGVERLGAPGLPFCPGRTDATDGSGWKPLEYFNAEFPKTVDALVQNYERRGLTAKEFVALTFPSNPSTGALHDTLKLDSSDILVEGLKFNPDLRMWAEYYLSAGDEKYANDFAAAWTKLMNSDRFDGPTRNLCNLAP